VFRYVLTIYLRLERAERKGKSYQLQVKAHDTAGQAGVSPILTVTH